MFFIIGSGQNSKQLNFDQLIICKSCQKYGHIQVFVIYTYVSFFFIPLFKWNRRYYAKMSCCGASCELSSDLGRDIERGHVTELDENLFTFQGRHFKEKSCSKCGYHTTEDFDFCPKCGNRL